MANVSYTASVNIIRTICMGKVVDVTNSDWQYFQICAGAELLLQYSIKPFNTRPWLYNPNKIIYPDDSGRESDIVIMITNKESGIYDLVHHLSLKNNTHIRHAAQKLYKRWHILVAAYEQSESVDKHPESMQPGCSSNSQRSSMPVSHKNNLGNHHSSPKPPATPDDAFKYYNSGDSSRSDEPTFHHGLEPESKSKNSKQDSRIHDPLQLESTRSHDSMEMFRLRADSGSSSGNSQRSGSTDPADNRHRERKPNNQHHQFGNGAAPNRGNDRDPARDIRMNGMIQPREGSSSSRENARKKIDVPVVNMNGVAESSPEDPNLSIEGSSEPTLISGGIEDRDAVLRTMEANLAIHEFKAVKGKSSNGEIPYFKILAYFYSRMGLVVFTDEMGRYFKEQCRCKNIPSDRYLRKAFDFYVNHTMRDHARMPRAPSPNHTFDFDKDFRGGMAHHDHRKSSGDHSKSMISNITVTEEHDTKNSSNHSGSIQVPSTPKSTSGHSKHEPNTFPGPADAASSKKQSASSVARKEAVPSHQEHHQHAVVKNVNESLKRKSDKSFPMKQPEQNSLEPPRKVPKTASSHSSLRVEPTTDSGGESHRTLPKASSSHSGFQGNQTANFSGESSKTAASSTCPGMSQHSGHKSSSEGSTSCVVKLIKSEPDLENPSHLNSHSSTPSTPLDVLINPKIQLISPIASPKWVPAAAPVMPKKEKRPKHRSKAVESPTLEPSTSQLSPIVDVVSRLSSSMSSPAMELARPGASKGSPSLDVKVPNPNGNHGPSTSKGTSKEASKEKKPRQTKKKPEKGKLWARAKKDFEVLRKRN